MMTRSALVAEAMTLRNAPFHHQGRVTDGIDCIGVIAVPAAKLGHAEALAFLRDPVCRGYGRQPAPKPMLAALARYVDEIPIDEARLADFLWMRFDAEPQHFALIVAVNPPDNARYAVMILHASAAVGKVVEHGLDATWHERVQRAYRYRGIAE